MTRALSDEDVFTLELESSPSETGTVLEPSPLLTTGHMAWYWQEMNGRNYHRAIDRLSLDSIVWIRTKCWAMPKSLLAGYAHRLLGEHEKSMQAYKSARVLLEAEVRQSPDDPRFHSSLRIAYAALGQKEEAVREGRKAVELLADYQGCLLRIPYVEGSGPGGFMC